MQRGDAAAGTVTAFRHHSSLRYSISDIQFFGAVVIMPRAGRRSALRKQSVNFREFIRSQSNFSRADILFQVRDLTGPWNRHKIVTLMENPS